MSNETEKTIPSGIEKVLPRLSQHVESDIRIRGAEQLHAELIRSRIFDTIATHIAQAGVDPVAFEFGLVIKW